MPKKLSFEHVKQEYFLENYILLSKEYKSTYSKLIIKCPNGHIYTSTRNSWRNGRRCPECYKINNVGKDSNAFKGGVAKRNIPLYDTYHPQISYCEETRRNPKEPILLQVRCSYCKKWINPNRHQVINRITALKKIEGATEARFYCNDECRTLCPVYKKQKYSAKEKPKKVLLYTSTELQAWSNEVFKRATYKCEYCDAPAEHAHHIQPKKLEPFYALDPDNGIAVCKKCHNKYGHSNKCSTNTLASVVCH